MSKEPVSFAGRVRKKGGKQEVNDYEQPEKFFAEMETFYRALDGIPFLAVEELMNYQTKREVIIKIVRRCFTILEAAKVDIVSEIEEATEDPFEGLEADIEVQKSKRNGEEYGEEESRS